MKQIIILGSGGNCIDILDTINEINTISTRTQNNDLLHTFSPFKNILHHHSKQMNDQINNRWLMFFSLCSSNINFIYSGLIYSLLTAFLFSSRPFTY